MREPRREPLTHKVVPIFRIIAWRRGRCPCVSKTFSCLIVVSPPFDNSYKDLLSHIGCNADAQKRRCAVHVAVRLCESYRLRAHRWAAAPVTDHAPHRQSPSCQSSPNGWKSCAHVCLPVDLVRTSDRDMKELLTALRRILHKVA